MSNVLIIGGGPAGMFSAICAAECGHTVTLLEKNEKLGKKLFITGKGRCNLTNACDMETLFHSVVTNSKFLYSSFYGFSNEQTMDWFENAGLRIKVERGDRVFPLSDHSSDVIRVLQNDLSKKKVSVKLNTQVIKVEKDEKFKIHTKNGKDYSADAVIVATGGLSYPSTGSTGDGFEFAKAFGHSVTECIPALVPIETKEPWVTELQGLSLKNTAIKIFDGKKKLYEDFGEMLFTHFGVSGPMIISASSFVGKKLSEKNLQMYIDLKPALSEEQLDVRVRRDFEENQNRQFKNAISGLFPSKLIPVMIELSGIDPEKKVNVITKEERTRFVKLIKHMEVTLTGLRSFREAIITKGGVKTKEIDPATMESKLTKGLYFVGEVLDLDALTGGFNLQVAWSTAYAAGISIDEK